MTAQHRVSLAFEDGVTRLVTCAANQTVADAAQRAGIGIPLDCGDGECGVCRAFCESGSVDGGTHTADALSPDEERAGYVLPCVATPRSDLVLRIATTSAVARTGAAVHHGTVTGLDRLSPTTVTLTIEIEDRGALTVLPGQYATIAVPGTDASRSYSFSNAPDDPALTFLIKIKPGGVMAEYLTSRVRVGEPISLTGPHGSFFLRESDAPLLLLAGGAGLAPILSMLRTLDAAGSARPVHLLYGATTDDDLVELDTIAALASSIPALTWDHCVADRATRARNQGYVTGLIEAERLRGGATAVYLCGPPAMVEGVRSHFGSEGLVPAGFFYEKFALAAGTGGYQIGEEHPSIEQSDALFDARCALELGALELVIGRLTDRQITGYRLLAEATLPYVDGDRFVDAAGYTETNAVFHDYLFLLTGNEHLAQAYDALGVRGHMEQTIRTATWSHPGCTQDHLDIVAAFEAADREGARQLIRDHADRSKQTQRRAMADAAARRRS